MAYINLYGTLRNVTGEYVALSEQIQYTDNTSIKDVLDSIYTKEYDFTKGVSYEDVSMSSHSYDSDKKATKIEGDVSIKVPKTATYSVQLVCKDPSGQTIIWGGDSKYNQVNVSNRHSFEETNTITFKIIGELYITKIRINQDCGIPTKLSDLYNDVGAVTVYVNESSLCIDTI